MKLTKEDYLRIKRTILKKLYSAKAFRKGHLLLETLQSGLPAHFIGFVKDILKDLIKERLVVYYGKTSHGLAYQLNIKELAEIERTIFSS